MIYEGGGESNERIEKNMKLNNLETYERVYSSHWFLTSYNGIGFVFDFPKIGGGNFISQVIYKMENQMCGYIFDREEFEKAANFTANKLINDLKWKEKIYQKINYYTEHYFEAGEKLKKTNLSLLSDKKIIQIIRKIINFQHYHQVYSVLANGIVLDGRNHLSNKIREELKRGLKYPKNFEKYWSLLSQTTKISLRQRKDYDIAQLAKKTSKLSKSVVKTRLKKLHSKYCWLDYNNMGPATSLSKFEQELNEVVQNKKNLLIPNQLVILKEKQKKLIRKLNLDNRLKFLVTLAQGVIWQKGYRKDVQYHGFYCYENLFRELARRKKVLDWQTLSFLFPWEVEKCIKSNYPSISELKQRRKFSIFTVAKSGIDILSGEKAKIFAKKIESSEDYSDIKEVRGQCAYVGKVCGKVKIIQIPADMKKMNHGDVLISQATSPDLLLAMKKASAIVTNTGGLICHAAITARELKIPCIVGTGKATLIFKDGDMVEVDANKGMVKKID